jgi:YHS domain-containing protein
MGFLGRIIRFLFWVLILSWAARLLGRVIGGAGPQTSPGDTDSASADEQSEPGKRLVKDPICGMHMAEELALPISAGGETQYFCSEECRSKYENSVLKRAASA